MTKKKTKLPRSASSKKFSGHDSLIISNKDVIRRSSIIGSAFDLANDRDDVDALPQTNVVLDEEQYFRDALQREVDEGKYVVNKKLTTGGMGAVYYIYDKDFRRYSAMKVVLPELKQNSMAIESFIREARITGQLEHPNIIPVHDMGYFPGYGIYFTMKLMQGEPLNVILQNLEIGNTEYLKKYDIYMLVNIFRKVCDAVAFAHSKDVLHRDIKPHNVMVGDYGEVLLMDWGLAKRIGTNDADPPRRKSKHSKVDDSLGFTTEVGVVKGSPAYMSPEQAMGDVDEFDLRSDIFLLGATLYNIFTFYPPYIGDNITEIVNMARNHELIPPDELDTGRWKIPEDMRRIIMKALSKDKSDRYESVAALISDIDAFLRGDINFCHRFFKKGEILIREGEIGAESYIIVKGAVRVDKKRNGRNVTICSLTEGDIVGEMALITSEARSASVTALEKTEVLVLTKELFTQHLTKLPPWLGQTIVLLAERLNATNNSIPEFMASSKNKKKS